LEAVVAPHGWAVADMIDPDDTIYAVVLQRTRP
jgi:hypothetical protein